MDVLMMMMMTKRNIQVYPFRMVGFLIKCTSQHTESLYGWMAIWIIIWMDGIIN